MMLRIRLIITALLVCHLFLLPPLVTSQLRPAPAQQNPAPTQSASTKPDSSTTDDEDDDDLFDDSLDTAPAQQQPPPPSKPPISAQTDTGQEDTQTEEMIEQELENSGGQDLGPQRPAINVPLGPNEVLIRADEQEKNQDIYNVRGHVEIRFGTSTLHADQATYDSSTGRLTATGHVVFDGGPHNEHLVGTRANYDVSRDTGTFYDVVGSSGVRVKNKSMFLTSSSPFFFTGKVVDKLGPDRYRVNQGYITSCALPDPKWKWDSKSANVELGNEAQMRHATLKIHNIPVFYFPYVEHPVDNLGRKSGFLIPEIGQSSTRGFILGDGFYWVLSRNADVTLGAALYASRGWAQFGNFRAIGYTYAVQAEYYGVIDQNGQPQTGQNQGGEELRVNGWKDLPDGFRAGMSVDYLTSYIFRLAFAQGFTEAINSEVRSYGFLSKNFNGYGLGFLASRYQNYESTAPGDFIEINHAPSLDFSTVERPFTRAGFVYAYDLAAEGVSRNEIGFSTAPVVGRVDANPYIALPAFLDGWTLRPEIGARETYYSQRLQPGAPPAVGVAVSDAINRNVVNASMEIRPPTLSRIFDRKLFGRVLKHTIEPYAIYRYQSGIDNFSQIIRFDERDILADTNEVEYGIVNRLYSKKTTSNAQCFRHSESGFMSAAAESAAQKKPKNEEARCDDSSGAAIDFISWEIAQKYFANTTFGGALVPGRRNVFDSTIDFTGIAFLTEPRLFSPIISRLRVQSGVADFQWSLDYDPVLHQINASTVFAGYRWNNWYLNGGQSYVNAPGEFSVTSSGVMTPDVFNQYRIALTYGSMNKLGFNGAVSVAADAKLDYIQASTIQTNYNWDCCGVAFQYQRWALGLVRNENAYRFTFSLTNVGSFGTLKRLQRLY
ncbi:MAG: LPS assembly protein LptD [Candidatus Korobacteraceae bacterium]